MYVNNTICLHIHFVNVQIIENCKYIDLQKWYAFINITVLYLKKSQRVIKGFVIRSDNQNEKID